MTYNKLIILLLLLAVAGARLFSQTASGGITNGVSADGVITNGVITSIQVTGLKRTRQQTAEKPLLRFLGKETAGFDFEAVKAVVLDMGILEPLSVEIIDSDDGEGKTLLVTVREKWSVFPVPVFFAGSGNLLAGVAFFDANAFGLNHKMALVGLYQTGGWTATALYFKPPDAAGTFGWGTTVLYSESEHENSDQKEESLRRVNLRRISGGGNLQYQFAENWTAALRLSWTSVMLRETPEPLRAPEENAHILKMEPQLSMRASSWDGYLLAERSISFSHAYSQGFSSPSFHEVSARGKFEKSLVPGFKAQIKAGAFYSPNAPPLFEAGPNEAQVEILPGSFSARAYTGLALGLEKYLFRFSFGTVSALGSWQMVFSDGPLLANQFDYGPLGALSLYMSRLAIPAMGFGVAYNIPARYFKFSFSIGMSF